MNREAAVEALLDQVRQLASADLRALADAGEKAIGFLGTRKPWASSTKAALVAAEAAGRTPKIKAWNAEAEGALLDAVLSAAQVPGQEVAEVKAAFDALHVTVQSDGANPRAARDEYRHVRALMMTVVGRHWERQFVPASGALQGVVLALLTWDLAVEESSYTQRMRDVIAGPWRCVGGLPQWG